MSGLTKVTHAAHHRKRRAISLPEPASGPMATDGFAVLRTLQDGRWSKYKETPILILSSVREEASRRRYELETALQLDVDDYVEKPISPAVLLERVESLIKKKRSEA